jgi:hypothetical protein
MGTTTEGDTLLSADDVMARGVAHGGEALRLKLPLLRERQRTRGPICRPIATSINKKK